MRIQGKNTSSDYEYEIIGDVVVIYDLNLGRMSVTNDIEEVIKEIGTTVDLSTRKIIYRDSCGVFDGITLNKERFYPINKTTLKEALNFIGEPCGGMGLENAK